MGQCTYCGTYHASRAFACPDCIERGLPPRANTKQASDLEAQKSLTTPKATKRPTP